LCLVIFPGGTVSTAPKPFGDARDPSSKTFTAGLIQKTHATVVPVFFSGENSRLFQIVSQYSMTLRLSLLLWELRNKMGDTITAVVGEPLTWDYLSQFNKRDQLMGFLRTHVYSLSPIQLTNVAPVDLKV
jgi:putative hemolysin